MDEIDKMLARLPADLAARVRPRVVQEGDCLIWTGMSAFKTRVPRIAEMQPNGKRVGVSLRRVIFNATSKRQAGNRVVTSTCGNYRCVNPAHLIATDHSGVMRIAVEHGKVNHARRSALAAAASRKAVSKLTEADVLRIRSSSEPARMLAEQFGVSRATINGIRSGRRWRNVDVWSSVFWRLAA
jgi:hypothetical protein